MCGYELVRLCAWQKQTESLDVFMQLCSVEVDCKRGAVMAATLANSGQCPTTGAKVYRVMCL